MLERYSLAELRHIAEDIVENLRECEDGSSFNACQLLMLAGYDIYVFSEEELLSIDNSLRRVAKADKIDLYNVAQDGKCDGPSYNNYFVVRNKRAQIKCPHCGSRDTARYIYEKPEMNSWAEQMLSLGKWALRDGPKEDNSPTRGCNACKKDFGVAPLILAEKGEVFDMRENVASIRFSVGGYFGGYTTITFRDNGKGALVSLERAPEPGSGILLKGPDQQITHARWQRIVLTLYNKMYLNEWEKSYVDPEILDGTGWSLEIQFRGRRKRSYSGINAYPAYWNELITMFRGFAKPYKL